MQPISLRITGTRGFLSAAIPFLLAVLALPLGSPLGWAAEWKPAPGPLLTRWAQNVSPTRVHAEYPRPQLQRGHWQNLNGLWQYAITDLAAGRPSEWQGEILVPFAIESALSGVMQRVGPQKRLWYRRTFRLPDVAAWKDRAILLHFGAVDWETQVWVNGHEAGSHRGGYDPFSLDIRPHLSAARAEQEVVVSVFDPTNAHWQPVGKQHNNPHGIWYTPTTGIWQTVWLEPVPRQHIQGLRLTPDIDAGELEVVVHSAAKNAKVSAAILLRGAGTHVDGKAHALDAIEAEITGEANKPFRLPVKNARLWSPDNPHLYELRVQLEQEGNIVDSVDSYFGMRKIAVAKDAQGVNRLFLNNRPLFHFGPLDQGFWPDGLYTAPSDEALRFDIEATKKMGFNCARKHVKVEPARWYYWCDRLGLMVWQDMPNGDRHIAGEQPDLQRSPESSANYETEWQAILAALHNFPSIVMWVPFNEGWGQFDTARIAARTRQLDPSRPVNSASGWTDRGVGDVHDIHVYPGPAAPQNEEHRAAVLGEFGGLGLPVEGHTWQAKDNWGYRSFTSREALTAAYEQNVSRLPRLIAQGLSAAIYTQTTDVEIEVNGLLTYDRALVKPDEARLLAANQAVFKPAPTVTTIVPAANERDGIVWRFTQAAPAAGWEKPGFDDSSWQSGASGFGTRTTPGTTVRTEWNSEEIWLRREFDLPDVKTSALQLLAHHDEDAEVYFNGVLAARVSGFTVEYATYTIAPEALAALKAGKNSVAVHCKQTGGGQYIDVGLVQVVPAKE